MIELSVLCSNEDCTEEVVVHVAQLGELDRHACVCGCAWVVLDVAEVALV